MVPYQPTQKNLLGLLNGHNMGPIKMGMGGSIGCVACLWNRKKSTLMLSFRQSSKSTT